jgi:hypothetical protein
MASGDDDSEDLTGGTHEARECMACRGTGRVISNLGGTSSTVDCPWCGGTGMRTPEIDAQAGWPANEVPPPPEAKQEKPGSALVEAAEKAEPPAA